MSEPLNERLDALERAVAEIRSSLTDNASCLHCWINQEPFRIALAKLDEHPAP